jgi:hypothetical protein
MSSANKLYKTSGSDLPFKEWLRREQLKGKLDIHNDTYLNMVGSRVPSGSNPLFDEDIYTGGGSGEADEDTNKVPTDNDLDLPEITYKRSDVIKFSVLSLVAGMLISKYVFKK